MKSLVERAREEGNLRTFLLALEKSGLETELKDKNSLTVFAPNDNAYAKLPQKTLTEILKEKGKLADITAYHIVEGKILLEDFKKTFSLKTFQGTNLLIDPFNLRINNSKIIKPDIKAENGIIHIIDEVLSPYVK
ncbi:MAG TPA: fasciclin domain-containing protein [Clostridia bacterium]|nr:fasciclin domain-containing protein [Clostridia bacterium]